MFSEKVTDFKVMSSFEKAFGCVYNTSKNCELFGSLIPDGWFIIERDDKNDLMIIENKKDLKSRTIGKNQLIKYYKAIPVDQKEKFNNFYLVLGTGTFSDFNYIIYKMVESKIIETNLTFDDLKINKTIEFDLKEIHKFNDYMYNNQVKIPNHKKTLFVAAILLTLKANPRFLEMYDIKDKGLVLVDKILETIKTHYKDSILVENFNFLKMNLNNKHLYSLMSFLAFDVKKYGIDILKQFYSEFTTYDKTVDSANGIVFTPHDIVQLMVKELNIKDDETLMDCCTGSGSFLLEGSKYTSKLIGCEYGEDEYTIAKCNFILHDIDYSNLYFNNCFNQKFLEYDHIILNPPFSTKEDENSEEKISNNKKIEYYDSWEKFNKELKFCMYQFQFLKKGGTGAWIIPRSNFNLSKYNSVKAFKKYLLENSQIMKIINCNANIFLPNAGTECTIIIFKKGKPSGEYITQRIDYSNDGYQVLKKRRIFKGGRDIKHQETILTSDCDWNYQKEIDLDFDYELEMKESLLRAHVNKILLLINDIQMEKEQLRNSENRDKYNVYYMSELLEPIKVKTYNYSDLKIDNEKPLYPWYSSKEQPVASKFINEYSVDCELLGVDKVLTISTLGGYCYVRTGRFAISSSVNVYKFKKELLDYEIIELTRNIHSKYQTYGNRFTNTLFPISKVFLPKEKPSEDSYKVIEQLDNEVSDIIEKPIEKCNNMRKVKLTDIFECLSVPKFTLKANEGNIPLYGATITHEPVRFIESLSFDTDESKDEFIKENGVVIINKTGNGGAGLCFKTKGKFAILNTVMVCKMKEIISDANIKIIGEQLHKIYNRGNSLTLEKFKIQEVNIMI